MLERGLRSLVTPIGGVRMLLEGAGCEKDEGNDNAAGKGKGFGILGISPGEGS